MPEMRRNERFARDAPWRRLSDGVLAAAFGAGPPLPFTLPVNCEIHYHSITSVTRMGNRQHGI